MPEWRDRYYRWMYRGGRPNWWARPQNRISAVIGGLLSTRMVTLEVTGRRTGRVISFPLAVADYDGERYLVSMLGQDANWVRNVRAANGRAVLWHGRRREVVHLDEVEVSARAPILRRYLERPMSARRRRSLEAAFPNTPRGFRATMSCGVRVAAQNRRRRLGEPVASPWRTGETADQAGGASIT